LDVLPAGFTAPTGKTPGSYISFYGAPQVDATQMDPRKNPPGLAGFSDTDRSFLINAYRQAAQSVTKARDVAKQVDFQGMNFSLNIGSAGILGFLLDPIGTVMTYFFAQIVNGLGDPIIILQGIGYTFLGLATTLWLMTTVMLFGLGIGTAIMSSINPGGFAGEYAILGFIPTFTAVIMGFWVLGGTFAYYVPLIPFIIFVFSAIGWLISVIEAMVAAPLVALGITHPEGHDLLGKSEQAVMLLLSVFLRPVLMIIGLFAGMIVSRVVLRFLNAGYFGILFDVGQYNPVGTVMPAFSIFTFLTMVVVYGMILITVVNQSFSLIYVVPDRVMRWLGVSEQTSGVQEALQASKGGYEQVAGAAKELSGGVGPDSKGYKKGLKDLSRKEGSGKEL
jgi:conjugal transfer/type IV secretion protein DotA/TraY